MDHSIWCIHFDLFIDGSCRLGEAHFLAFKCCCVHKDKMIDLEDVVNITNIRWRSRIFVFLILMVVKMKENGCTLYYTIPLPNLNNKSVDLLIVTLNAQSF